MAAGRPDRPGLAVEICVTSVADAMAAEAGGADRVELCQWLDVGGVTPGPGAIALACERLAIPVHVLIRPRPGDFVVSRLELDEMRRDIEFSLSAGAAGVVVGALTPGGQIDVETTRQLIEAARPMSVTFHRSFDETPDADAALDTLIALGIDRVLTAGHAPDAARGLPTLHRLHQRAHDRLIILAAGRVSASDVPRLREIGLQEFHAGSSACVNGQTHADAVARLVSAARGH